jgi:tetratricopeptide (TPR) repeat protein
LTPVYAASYEELGVELAATGHRDEAITAFQNAIALARRQPGAPATWYAKLGQVLRAQGRPEEAAEAFRQAVTRDPIPGWSGLAAARLDQGRFADARAATERLLGPATDNPLQRQLRRQLQLCDLLLAVEAKLPTILVGKERPTDVPTQLALAEWCLKHKRLTSTSAGFYASALAAQPSLANDGEAGHRFNAACAAALASCGVGPDASQLDDRRRAELRKQALDWLTAEYDVWAKRHRVGTPGERTVVAQAVRSWQGNEDLAGVRDEQALARLLPGDRRDWETLWSKVATLAARDPVELVKRAREHVGRLEWGKAVACYAEALELAPTDDAELWFEYAASQLLAGDLPGYRRACAHMLARCQASKMRSYLAARACTLAPDSADDPELPRRLSQGELQGSKNEFWSLTEQAALHVRAGRFQDAIPLLEASLRVEGRPARAVLSWLWLALAYQKQGKAAEARRWLKKAVNWLDQQGGQMPLDANSMGAHPHNWLEAHVLKQEAEARLR